MKKNAALKIYLLIIGFGLMFLTGCKKDEENKTPTPSTQIPVLTTGEINNITQSSATSGGNITSDGGATVIERGVCWSIGQTPTINENKTNDGTGTGSFTSNITGLEPNTNYYVRSFATNSNGTSYGSAISFKTLESSGETVTDIDGNVYHTITIGTQVWMLENLKTTKYRNGEPITYLTEMQDSTGAYCDYENSAVNSSIYGRLYNYAAIHDSRNICPNGWHVPTNNEWSTLIEFLGGENIAGGKLKETGATHWNSPNTGATNESGFTALPGGARFDDGFFQIGDIGVWWSSTEKNVYFAWSWQLWNGGQEIYNDNDYPKRYGFSIRCVKDDW